MAEQFIVTGSTKDEQLVKIPLHTPSKDLVRIPQSGRTEVLLRWKDFVLSGSLDTTIKMYEVKGCNLVHVFTNHSQTVRCLATVGESTLVSGSWDNTLRFFNLETKELIHTRDHNITTKPNAIISVCNIDDTQIACCDFQGNLSIIDVATFSLVQQTNVLSESTPPSYIQGLVYSSSSNTLYCSVNSPTIKAFDLNLKEVVTLEHHTAPVTCILSLEDHLISTGRDGVLCKWTGNKLVWSVQTSHGVASSAIFRRNEEGGVIYTSGADNKVRSWSFSTGQELGVVAQDVQSGSAPISCLV
ncbi:hypothetical protein AKO1_006317 [Acrasis kona]|uniref:Uncharacterized protein n=1 Tax=Acrasis kona TaxID=1008807 RepID=A0AAW2YHZ6_9EUKA